MGNTEIIKQFLDHSKLNKETVKYQDLILLAEESSKTLFGDKKSEVIKLLKSCDPENFTPAVIIRKKSLNNTTDNNQIIVKKLGSPNK